MQTRRRDIFTTVRTEGGILPADLLQRIVSADKSLDGLTPENYHLAPGEKINEAINRAWNRLQGSWESFRAAAEKLPTNDPGTSVTRERWLLPLFQELGYGRLRTAPAIDLDGKTYETDLRSIANHTSETERRAAEAERELVEWKKVKFMIDRVGDEFEGLIISTLRFGFFVELQDLFIEGLVPMETLPGDRYQYHENTRKVIGIRTRRAFSIGDQIRVRLDRVDLLFGLDELLVKVRRRPEAEVEERVEGR